MADECPPLDNNPKQFSIRLSGPSAAERSELERFICDVYKLIYGAQIKRFKPMLVSLRDDQGNVLAACGYRNAATGRLFLETYLDEPVEAVLSSRCGSKVFRENIIEIGNFAAHKPGMLRQMVEAFTPYLYETGVQWAVFTIVPEIRNAFERLGIRLVHICLADRDRLDPVQQKEWGSYYDVQPQVMACNVPQSYFALKNNTGKVKV
ncbi:MAG: thermostable hemolysin [Gallionellaceae bacterium]|nr:thermostable hemolysin [Gallionellaceae bacterium]